MLMGLRIAVGVIGLFNILLGLLFLFRPAEMAVPFAIEPIGSQGLATIRADFTGFFVAGGTFALLGAWRQESAPLRVPILLLAVALLGRTLSLLVDGVGPMALPPMGAEALMIAVLVVASRKFDRRG